MTVPRSHIVSSEDVCRVEGLTGPGETRHRALPHGAHRGEGEGGEVLHSPGHHQV